MPREGVTRVIDGDTFMTAERKRAVRLANCDAPEKGERGAQAATKRLKTMIEGKDVNVNEVAKDVYGRTVAKVTVGGCSVEKAVKEKTVLSSKTINNKTKPASPKSKSMQPQKFSASKAKMTTNTPAVQRKRVHQTSRPKPKK